MPDPYLNGCQDGADVEAGRPSVLDDVHAQRAIIVHCNTHSTREVRLQNHLVLLSPSATKLMLALEQPSPAVFHCGVEMDKFFVQK